MRDKKCELRDKMKNEALERLNLMGADTETKEKLLHENQLTKVFVNFEEKRLGKFEMTEEEIQMVKDFEEKYDTLVYYMVEDTVFWSEECSFHRYSLLFVSKNEEEWQWDKEECIERCGTVPVYVANMEIPEYSEVTEMKYESVEGLLMNAS